MTKDILVITDEVNIFHDIKDRLIMEHIGIYYAGSIDEVIWRIQIHSFCLVILDILSLDEIEIKKIIMIRQVNPMPIFVLAEGSNITQRVEALKSGADDFLQKPYAVEECLARIHALIRRYTELNYYVRSRYEIVSNDGLLLDIGRRTLTSNGQETRLTPREYGILVFLMKNRRQIMTYEQIYEAVWKEAYMGEQERKLVFYQVGRLRRKLGRERIESVYGVGYRLKEPME